jgi:hemoglobin
MAHEFKSLYDLIGEEGFNRLVSAFYRRVETDPILRPLYPEAELSGAERRLRMFLIQYFGGPTAYSEERGHPRLRMRHAPFVIGERERDAWVTNMLAAMDEAAIPEPAYTTMKDYFEKGASFMMNATPFGGMLHETKTT